MAAPEGASSISVTGMFEEREIGLNTVLIDAKFG